MNAALWATLGLALTIAAPRDARGQNSDSARAMAGAMAAMGDDHMAHMKHMAWSPLKTMTAKDSIRAMAIADTLRRAIAKYADTTVAVRDGYKMFAPAVKTQAVYHFTRNASAIKAAFAFDPAKPTSLLYKRDAKTGHLKLVGAMYTAPARYSSAQLDARVPLSVAQWHQHVNLCVPRDKKELDRMRAGDPEHALRLARRHRRPVRVRESQRPVRRADLRLDGARECVRGKRRARRVGDRKDSRNELKAPGGYFTSPDPRCSLRVLRFSAMAAQFIYVMKGLTKVVPPSRVILKDIWLSFYPGAKIGVLGANGAGKSSLLRVMAGLDDGITGEAWAAPGTKIGYLPQEPVLDETKTVKENVELGLQEVRDLLTRFNDISAKFAEPMDDKAMEKLLAEQARVQEKIDHTDAWNLDHKLELAMDALRCPPPDSAVTHLSGGEKRRVALCKVLLEQPDMLLLDEPTNHLDAESVFWLERHLAQFPGTVVAITHDRYFLDNVAKWILELDRGSGIPWEGNYSSWLDQKQTRMAQEEKQASARQRTLQHELEWVRMNPRARQAKSKSRLQRYEELASAAQLDRIVQNEIVIPPAPRLGNDVVIAENLKKGYGDKLLFDGMSFALPRAGIVGVIGPNGAGKTTLFRMIMGTEKPDGGTLKVGDTVQISYQDQNAHARGKAHGVGRIVGRRRPDDGRQQRDQFTRVYLELCVPRRRPAKARRELVGRRAEPAAPGEDADAGRQPPAARRTDQRPRRGHVARARRRVARFCGMCGGHLARPVVPGSRRDPHSRLRRGLRSGLVRRKLSAPTTKI